MRNEQVKVIAQTHTGQRDNAALLGHAMIAGLAILSLAVAVMGMITQLG